LISPGKRRRGESTFKNVEALHREKLKQHNEERESIEWLLHPEVASLLTKRIDASSGEKRNLGDKERSLRGKINFDNTFPNLCQVNLGVEKGPVITTKGSKKRPRPMMRIFSKKGTGVGKNG